MEIIGHQKIIEFLNKSMVKKNLANAYIFTGPEHLGKFTVAKFFAQQITQSSAVINPNISLISPPEEEKKGIIKKKSIKIEQIRELQHSLSLSPYAGSLRRVAIIDEADKMNSASQNALLKMLEEPIGESLIILIVHNLERILVTLKSRCLIKKFSLVSQEEIASKVNLGKNKKEFLFWSFGRPGVVMNLLHSPEAIIFYQEAKEELEQLFGATVSRKFSLAERLSKQPAQLIDKLNIWVIILRNKLKEKNNLSIASLKKIFFLIQKIEKSLKTIKETNANVKLILENLLLDF